MSYQPSLLQHTPESRFLIDNESQVVFYPHFLDSQKADRLFSLFQKDLSWKQDQITLYGKTHDVPRLQTWYGDSGLEYSYSGIQLKPQDWEENLFSLKQDVENFLGETFNAVLANYYRSGQDYVAWHSDNEKELGPRPNIASISLGEERKFVLRNKETREKVEVFLNHGSLLLMAGNTQKEWEHMLPRSKKTNGERINLTFRKIYGSFT